MTDVIYTKVPGKIPSLLGKIKQVGVPSKVSTSWLKTIGFTSSNDTSLIGVLRVAGLIDGSNTPNERWNKYRGSYGAAILGEGIREGYADLYAVYPDAHLRTNNELEHVFSTSSKAGKQVIQKAVSTFKNLSSEAEFDNGNIEEDASFKSEPLHSPVSSPQATQRAGSSSSNPSLHIDIQVHISSEASAEQIDQIFASMSKHLYGRS